MLKIIQNGDIFTSSCDFLINPVNVVGIMGKGLALEFKKRFPRNFQVYQKCCKDGSFVVGKLLVVPENGKAIVNFPTKVHWKDNSTIDYIKLGLEKLKIAVQRYNIKSIAFPKVGCGLGNLDWNDVFPLIEAFSNSIDQNILVEVYI